LWRGGACGRYGSTHAGGWGRRRYRPPKKPEEHAMSPWELKGRIILKGKRHDSPAADDEDEDGEISISKEEAKKKGLSKKLVKGKSKKEGKKQHTADSLSRLIYMNAGNKKELGELWKNGAYPFRGVGLGEGDDAQPWVVGTRAGGRRPSFHPSIASFIHMKIEAGVGGRRQACGARRR
jgi:hypothetical protein